MTSMNISVRVRPFNQRELNYRCTNIITMCDNMPGAVTAFVVREGKVTNETKKFMFNNSFWTHNDVDETITYCTQEMIYNVTGKPILNYIMDGYNATLFAYGQTGSGKTYTMIGYGDGDERGTISRMCDDLFIQLHTVLDTTGGSQWTVECSYLEIYNEQVRDLLTTDSTDKDLRVRQHPKTGVFVEGLKKVSVSTSEEIAALLNRGACVRATASTAMNSCSSRSHAILLVTLSTIINKQGIIDGKYSRLSLVDLAGSERVSSTGAIKDVLKEATSINKSLTTLRMCLSRLADNAGRTDGNDLPIPIRDSTLTFLLHDSFGGNSKTAMIATISPADICYEETISTLRFAQVTKNVKDKAVVNENPTSRLIRELTEELSMLKEKLSALYSAPATKIEDTEVKSIKLMIDDSEAALATQLSAPDNIKVDNIDKSEHNIDEIEDHMFIDWRKPQLINLCPESHSLAVHIPEGESFVLLENPNQCQSAISLLSSHAVTASCSTPPAVIVCKLHFYPLTNAIVVMALNDGNVSINGEMLHVLQSKNVDGSHLSCAISHEDIYAHTLVHGDRIMLGEAIFRLSHTSSLTNSYQFSKLYVSLEHVEVSEDYHRKQVIHQYYVQQLRLLLSGKFITEDDLLSSDADDDGVEVYDDSGDSNARDMNDSFVVELRKQIRIALSDERTAEGTFSGMYPITGKELIALSARSHPVSIRSKSTLSTMSYVSDIDEYESDYLLQELPVDPDIYKRVMWEAEGMEEYKAKRREYEAALEKNNEMIVSLRSELEHKLNTSEHTEADGKINLSTDEVEVEVMRELEWHKSLKRLQVFKSGGPSLPSHYATWRRFAEYGKDTLPFLHELLKTQERFYGTEKCGRRGSVMKMKQGRPQWDDRYIIIIDSFLMYFNNSEGIGRCLGAIYLLGANVSIVAADDVRSIRSNGKDASATGSSRVAVVSTTPYIGRKNVMLIKATTPRRLHEPTHCNFYLSFETTHDMCMWCHWIVTASIPPMPPHMIVRMTNEVRSDVLDKTILKPTDMLWRPLQLFAVPPSEWLVTDTSVSTENEKHLKWKNDEVIQHCEGCKALFTLFRRKHHCRVCGGIFCDSCCPKLFGKKRKRICSVCLAKQSK